MRTVSRWSIIITIMIMACFSSPNVVSEANAQMTNGNGKIDQGEAIQLIDLSTNKRVACTIGYVSQEESRVYTAGHCGNTGDFVLMPDENDMVIGTLTSKFNKNNGRNDVAWIDVLPHLLGSNYYSGNNIVDSEIGDTICSYGAKSKEILCGVIRGHDGDIIIASNGGIQGDSGGPAWTPGKGLVGTYSFFWSLNDKKIGTAFTKINANDHKKESAEVITENTENNPLKKLLTTLFN